MKKTLFFSLLSLSFLGGTLSSPSQTTFASEERGIEYRESNFPVHDHTGGGGYTNLWTYRYSSGPYAFFYNDLTKQWKIVQVMDNVSYTIKVISDGIVGGWTGNSSSAKYYNPNHAKLRP